MQRAKVTTCSLREEFSALISALWIYYLLLSCASSGAHPSSFGTGKDYLSELNHALWQRYFSAAEVQWAGLQALGLVLAELGGGDQEMENVTCALGAESCSVTSPALLVAWFLVLGFFFGGKLFLKSQSVLDTSWQFPIWMWVDHCIVSKEAELSWKRGKNILLGFFDRDIYALWGRVTLHWSCIWKC